MTQPLALLLYEKLFPASHLLTRLEDLGYRVQSLAEPQELCRKTEEMKPLLVIADLEPKPDSVCHAISDLVNRETTAHVPVIAISTARNEQSEAAARNAGAKLVVQDNAIIAHLDQFLDQALEV